MAVFLAAVNSAMVVLFLHSYNTLFVFFVSSSTAIFFLPSLSLPPSSHRAVKVKWGKEKFELELDADEVRASAPGITP